MLVVIRITDLAQGKLLDALVEGCGPVYTASLLASG